VLGYGVSVTLLGVAFVALSPASWLSADHLGASLVAVTVGWLTGQVRAVARLRVPVFDVPLPSEAGGEAGDPAGGRPGARPGVRSRAPAADPDDRQARPAGR